MKPETRKKYLEEVAKTNFGIALREWFDIEIKKLENINLIPKDGNYEIEGKARGESAKILKRILNILKNNKEEKEEETKTSYE
ncbi:MAG: hypothetical protein ACTSPI_13875 [Candidatus Heimdallarchaeaceae archaeon]